MDGILNIFKNKGMSSFDVVRKVKQTVHMKKVGHTGTLDPMAEGVLPVAVGKGTKIIDYIMDSDKEYKVEFKLGIKTDTYDLEGKVINEYDTSNITENQVRDTIESFVGEYYQVPPMYSALKQNGVRLYELARKGIEVERKGRKINIKSIYAINIDLPYVTMTVTCGKGTYIRSLCYDIGEKLKCGAVMTKLKRSRTSIFEEENSINIEELNGENIESNIISIEDALKFYPKFIVKNSFTKLLINGVKVFDKRLTDMKCDKDVLYRVYDDNDFFIGLGKQDEQGFKIVKLLV